MRMEMTAGEVASSIARSDTHVVKCWLPGQLHWVEIPQITTQVAQLENLRS